MNLHDLSRPAAVPPAAPAIEPIPGQDTTLESAAAAGRRAADWLRSLPGPAGNPITGDLADAVQQATARLDPADCDDRDRWGDGGVPQALRDRLDAAYGLTTVQWLSPAHKAVIVAVTGCVLAMPKALANDPITAVEEDVPALCAMLDSAVDVLAAAAHPAPDPAAHRAAPPSPGAVLLEARRSAPCLVHPLTAAQRAQCAHQEYGLRESRTPGVPDMPEGPVPLTPGGSQPYPRKVRAGQRRRAPVLHRERPRRLGC